MSSPFSSDPDSDEPVRSPSSALSNRKKPIILVAIVAVLAVIGGFLLLTTTETVGGSDSESGSESSEASITPSGELRPPSTSTGEDPPELVPVGQFLMSPIPSEMIVASPETIAKFGERNAEIGVGYALALAQATAYDDTIWEKILKEGAAVETLPVEDFRVYMPYMNETGKAKWMGLTGDPRVLVQEPGPGDLIAIPPQLDNAEWVWPYLRPSANNAADSFTVVSSTVGPKSKDGSGPTMVVTLKDYHIYDFKQDGEWVAIEASRDITYTLSQTNDYYSPWLLEDWKVTPGESRWVPAWEH
jgi:hypothetical protein